MTERLLASCLRPVLEAEAHLRRRRAAAGVLLLGAAGLVAFALASEYAGWWSWRAVFAWIGVLAVLGLVMLRRASAPRDLREVARQVERNHPELQAALLAALDQKPGPDGGLSYLQRRLLGDVAEHAVRHRWVRQVSVKRLRAAAWMQFASILAFFGALWLLLGAGPELRPDAGLASGDPATEPASPEAAKLELAVTPGDVEVEKGSRLVIEARFSGRAPSEALLLVADTEGERRIPMVVGLDDSVFSALLAQVDLDATYTVTYEGQGSPDYSIEVYEHPELRQADALVTPPAMLGEDPKELLDTRKITVMEGSEVGWRIHVNQPVELAELFGEDEVALSLEADPEDPRLLRVSHLPLESQRYRLHLVDAAGRSNRRPPWLTVNVQRNTPPEIRITFPGQDFEVSAVQELQIEAEVWDDVGVLAAGFSYQVGNDVHETILADSPLEGGTRHPLAADIDLEALGASPRDLVTYHFWAEDLDSAGERRRTTSDLFFAEVRFFEEILREGMPQSGQGQGPQGDADALLELQKDVVNAAWRLLRYHELGRDFETLAEDLAVLEESQAEIRRLLEAVLLQTEDADLRAIYEEAGRLMDEAVEQFALILSEQDGDLIAPAHQAARAVFAKLIEARAREQQISLSRDASSGQGQRQQRNMNLELSQRELKYEEATQASPEEAAEQAENLAILSRLKELARRQEAIAEKIKELQNQLQTADEEQRAEIERQLKRLQEEQRELLRDTDELAQRMDSEQNRPKLGEERDRLEEARENIRETAEQLESGELADAANSATRAESELREMEESFRERTSRRFSEEMAGLRERARSLAENQEALGEALEELGRGDPERAYTTEGQLERGRLAQEMAAQANDFQDLVEEIKSLSEQSEVSEPVLSELLYDAVRRAATSGLEDKLEEARDYTFYNRPGPAMEAHQAASRGIEELREGVERAAERVLGNEAEALRMARSEVDQLIDQSRGEGERLAATEPGGEPGEPGERAAASGDESSEEGRTPGQTPSDPAGDPAGETDEEGRMAGPGRPGDGEEAGQPGEGGEPGRGPGEPGDEEGSGLASAPGEPRAPGEGEPSDDPAVGVGQPGEEGQAGQSPGQSPGESMSQSPGETPGESPGQSPGDSPGQSPGEGGMAGGPGESSESSESSEGAPSDSPGAPGPGDPSGEGAQPGQTPGPGQMAGGDPSGGSLGGNQTGGNQLSGGGGGFFFDQPGEVRDLSPFTGEGYVDFRDRLGQLEAMLSNEELRNDVARVSDAARDLRLGDARRNQPPQAAVIEQRITAPLVELRQRLNEEIAKLNRENPIAPIDRDPVPAEFRDLVRRYYEQLGSGD